MAENDSAEARSDPAVTQAPGPPATGTGARMIEVGERVLGRLGSTASAVASRRGLPLAIVGGLVVALAWVGERDSAWGFPMLAVGGLMIGLGLIGPRLSGSLALRWGEDGAFLQLSSTIAPPGRRRRAPELASGRPHAEEQAEAPERLVPPSEIEGVAETVEFKVEAVRAGLEATEGSESQV